MNTVSSQNPIDILSSYRLTVSHDLVRNIVADSLKRSQIPNLH